MAVVSESNLTKLRTLTNTHLFTSLSDDDLQRQAIAIIRYIAVKELLKLKEENNELF